MCSRRSCAARVNWECMPTSTTRAAGLRAEHAGLWRPQTKNIKAKEQTPDNSTKAEAENLKRKLDNTPTAEAVETKTNPTQQETAEAKAKLGVAGTTNQPEKPKPAQPDTAEFNKARARTKFKPVLSYYPTDSAEGDAVVSLDGKPFSYDFTVKRKSVDQRLIAVEFQVEEFDKAAHDEDNVFVFDTDQPFDPKKPFVARIDGSQNSSLSTIGGNAKRGGNILSDKSMNGLLEWVKWFYYQENPTAAIYFLKEYLQLIANGTSKATLQIRANANPNAPVWYIPVTTKVQKATDFKKYFLDKITISNNDRQSIENFTPYVEGMLKAMINLARTIQNAKTGARNQGKFFTPVIIYAGQEPHLAYTQALSRSLRLRLLILRLRNSQRKRTGLKIYWAS